MRDHIIFLFWRIERVLLESELALRLIGEWLWVILCFVLIVAGVKYIFKRSS